MGTKPSGGADLDLSLGARAMVQLRYEVAAFISISFDPQALICAPFNKRLMCSRCATASEALLQAVQQLCDCPKPFFFV